MIPQRRKTITVSIEDYEAKAKQIIGKRQQELNIRQQKLAHQLSMAQTALEKLKADKQKQLIVAEKKYHDAKDENVKTHAERVAWLYGWISRAIRSGNKHIIKAGMSMFNHREGILAWYDHKITTAMVEGINNKIKVMKREAYGFTDDRYFKLRLLALHDAGITPFL